MIAFVLFKSRRDVMGAFTNKRLTDIVAIVGTVTIIFLNVVLLLQTFGVAIPGLPNG
jgi:manganese transport protein